MIAPFLESALRYLGQQGLPVGLKSGSGFGEIGRRSVAMLAGMQAMEAARPPPLIDVDGNAREAAKTGMAIGGTIGTGVIMVFWAMGAFILGLLVLFTRGRKTIVEEQID